MKHLKYFLKGFFYLAVMILVAPLFLLYGIFKEIHRIGKDFGDAED